MKKRLITVLFSLSFVLAIAMAPAAYAAEADLVYDGAGIFTVEEWTELSERADAISVKYNCDVAITILEEFTDDDSVEAWAEFVFEYFDYGWGADKSGVLFLISINDRETTILAHGYGNTAFTDHGKDVIYDRYVLPLLQDSRYYDASSMFLEKAEEFLALARGGAPFDVNTDEEQLAEKAKGAFAGKVAATIIIPLLISLVICLIWRGQMKTARIAKAADNYIPAGGFNLTRYEDRYLYSTQTREKIEKSSGSSGGTTVNSRGYSSSSRKF